MRGIPLLYTIHYRIVFTVQVLAVPEPRADSPCLSNRSRPLQIVRPLLGSQKEFVQSTSGRLVEFCHLFSEVAESCRSARTRHELIKTHLAHSVVGCLPATCLADDQRRVTCVGMENSRVVCSEEDIVNPNR